MEDTHNIVIIFLAFVESVDKQLMISSVCLDVNHVLTGLCMTKIVDCIDSRYWGRRFPSPTVFIFNFVFFFASLMAMWAASVLFPLPTFANIGSILPHVSRYCWHWEIKPVSALSSFGVIFYTDTLENFCLIGIM